MGVSGVQLTEAERNLLITLSYKDMAPPDAADYPMSFEDMLQEMIEQPNLYATKSERDAQELFCESLLADMRDNPDRYPNLASAELTEYYNDNGDSGYVGYAFEDANGNNIILSRGSEDNDVSDNENHRRGEDWDYDLNPLNKAQAEEAEAFYSRNVEGDEGTLAIGHSLGGGLSIYLVALFQEDDRVEAYVVNAADKLPDMANDAAWDDRVYAVCTEGDSLHGTLWGAGSARGEGYCDELITVRDKNGDAVSGDTHTLFEWKFDKDGPVYKGDYLSQLKPVGGDAAFQGVLPIRVDTMVLLQLASRVRHAADLVSRVDGAIDALGRTLANDALEVQRDGNVNESLGRGVALQEMPPRIAALVGRLRGEATNLLIDIKSFFDGGLGTGALEKVDSYLGSVASEVESAEEWLVARANRL